MTDAAKVHTYPVLRAGHVRDTSATIRIWLEVAWLMLAEGRAYIEDLEGGAGQPQMQQAAKLRLLEQLADIDNRLAGRVPTYDSHCLALALEYGMHDLLDVTGLEIIEIFGLQEEFGGPTCRVEDAMTLWERLLEDFPGALPDRLVAQGQRDMLLTFRHWADLARAHGMDVGLLTPFIKSA